MVGSSKNCIDPKTEEEIPSLETIMLRWFRSTSELDEASAGISKKSSDLKNL